MRCFIAHGRWDLIQVTEPPSAVWVWRPVSKATAWGRYPTYLIRDRDRVSGGDGAARAQALGIQTLLTPFHAPTVHAIAERVVRTRRTGGLDHSLIRNEQHLNEQHRRTVLAEDVAFYLAERPHHSLALAPPLPAARSPVPTARSGRGQGWAGSTTALTARTETFGVFAPNTCRGQRRTVSGCTSTS